MLKADGLPVIAGGIEKMSKSKNNGVDPQDLINRYGADTVRLYTMFTAPPDQSLEWSDEGVEGAHRFLKRLWSLAAEMSTREIPLPDNLPEQLKNARLEIHSALKKALFDYDRQQYNTVVSSCMSMVNQLYKLDQSEADLAVLREGMGIVLRLLAPISPHITHFLWKALGFGDDILKARWPELDETALVQDSIEYVVQVNGKVRGKIAVPADAEKPVIEAMAKANENVQRFTDGATIRKIIVVPNKLVSIVAN
jgi:leucyl-tRNA synthetase